MDMRLANGSSDVCLARISHKVSLRDREDYGISGAWRSSSADSVLAHVEVDGQAKCLRCRDMRGRSRNLVRYAGYGVATVSFRTMQFFERLRRYYVKSVDAMSRGEVYAFI